MSEIQSNIQITKIEQTSYSSDYKIFKSPLKQPICVISPTYGNTQLLENIITKVKNICSNEVPNQKAPYFVSAGGIVKSFDSLQMMYNLRVSGEVLYNLLSMDEFLLCNYLHCDEEWKNPDFLKRWLSIFGLQFHKSVCEHYNKTELLSDILDYANTIKNDITDKSTESEVIEKLVKVPEKFYDLFTKVRELLISDISLCNIKELYNFAGNNSDRKNISWIFSPIFKFSENVVIVPSFYEFKLSPGKQNLVDMMSHIPVDTDIYSEITHAFNFHNSQEDNDFCFGNKELFSVKDSDPSLNIKVNTVLNSKKNKYTAVLFINDSVRFIQVGIK